MVRTQYRLFKIKIGFNILCLISSIICLMWSNRESPAETLVARSPLVKIVIYPVLFYTLFFLIGLVVFAYCLEHINNEHIKKMNTIRCVIVFVYCIWSMIVAALFLTEFFVKNKFAYAFFTISYEYMRLEINRHIIVALGMLDAFNTANRISSRLTK